MKLLMFYVKKMMMVMSIKLLDGMRTEGSMLYI